MIARVMLHSNAVKLLLFFHYHVCYTRGVLKAVFILSSFYF